MGLGNSNLATYLSIYAGKIALRVKEPTEKSRSRINKQQKEVHEEFFDHVEGIITDISVREHADYGRSWLVTIVDGDQTFILQMPFSGGHSTAFLKILPNVDLSCKVKIAPHIQQKEGKDKASIFIIQHGVSIKWYFKKDDTKGLPPMVKQKFKGKEVWDDSDQMDFLVRMVNEEIKPRLGSPRKPTVLGADPLDEDIHDEHSEVTEPLDDLPF